MDAGRRMVGTRRVLAQGLLTQGLLTRRRLAQSVLAAGLCLAAIACHRDKAGPDASQERTGGLANDGAIPLLDGGDPLGPPDTGSLRLTASPGRLCPDQCATLALSPAPDPASRYDWRTAGLLGPGPHRVCPTGTTRYAVEVTQETTGIEFGPEAEMASVTVSLRDDCDGSRNPDAGPTPVRDGGVGPAPMGDGGIVNPNGQHDPRVIPPPRPDWREFSVPACEASFSATEGVIPIGVSGGEHPVVAGWFRGTLTVGATTLSSGSTWMNGFVARYDAECKPLWARSLFGLVYTVVLDVIEGPDGSLFVTGAMQGLADLGLGLIDSGGKRDILLLRLDPDTGATLWQRRFQTTETPGANQGGRFVGFDSTGHLWLHGRANHNTDFGLGPLAPPPVPGSGQSDQVDFLARFAQDGTVVETRPAPPQGALALASDDSMRAAWRTQGPVAFGAQQVGDGDTVYQALGMVGPGGSHGWLAAVPDGKPDTMYRPDGLAVDRDGTTYWVLASGDDQAVQFSVAAVDAHGAFRWRSPVTAAFPRAAARGQDIVHAVAVDGHGSPWVVGHVDGSLPVAGRMLTSKGERDIAVLRLGTDGQPDFGGLVGTAGDDNQVLLRGLSSGAALVVYGNDGVTVRLARLSPGN